MSSQTMTAPAVGHRPPDSGPDTPMHDYGYSQDDPTSPTASRSASATRDMHNSAPTSKALPATSSMGIKTEPSDGHDSNGNVSGNQKDLNTQSAAGALLAQLLGNPSAPNSTDATGNHSGQQLDTQDVKMDDSNGFPATDQSTSNDMALGMQLPQDSTSPSRGMQSTSNGNGKPATDILAEIDATQQQEGKGITAHPWSHPFFLPSILPQPPKNAFEALQQNELLTAAYLSQGADLSALGYQDGSASVAGSEPRIQAFAKLEFDDGHFYVNTYSFILGRDVRAARAAHQREIQFRQAVRSSRAKSSSGGNTSHTPNRMKREESAAMMGSVVSDRGANLNISRRSSKSSFDDSAMPLSANPAQLQTTTVTDYNALAMQSLQSENNGDAKPVDALALLPSPDSCPTIPIHPPSTIDGTAAGHRGISRRHVRIAYNFDRNLFEMEVMGRNGAFIGADWLSPGQLRPLHSGDYIQIGGVRIRFLLPDVPIGETGADRMEEPQQKQEDEDLDAEAEAEIDAAHEIDAEHEIDDMALSDSPDSKDPSRPKVKSKDDDSRLVQSIESGDKGDQPARRRGPGRPPKDGIMSKRERAELAREQKMAAKREANGGVTPPTANRPTKAGKTITGKESQSVGAESPTSSVKPAEKRKYTKRKKGDGTLMDFPLPSTEGGQFPPEQRPEEYVKPPPVKKRKPSRSPSPNYPPESAYSPEDLAKPPYNYAVLIFDALTEAGTPMTLKQIYRALKLKYPYFRFKCETEGWTSSVRHNLNGNGHLFMHAERDGKGWSWQLRPGASVEKEKKRRPSPPPPQAPPSAPPQQYMPPMPHSYAPPPGPPGTMPNQRPHQHQHQHQHFQFPSMPSNFPAPSANPQHPSPYPPPTTAAPPISTPAPPPPASAPAPQPHHVPPPHHQAQQPRPPPPGPQGHQQQPLHAQPNRGPNGPPEPSSFNERANKALDDFEAVLMEDYEDKNYIREVLRSARARVLGNATESSFPGGEPKDEKVIMDVLGSLVGSLKDE
ncbi:hypothetical protein N7450_005190 [Penicillium hetheringtonii]|uniref:Uncharacterized protein n=1 Tax=Penicillium hetheringtonii TaxID=911720 RepID=A0AAD6DRG9_9EURO|nr:hypothetical protein N7450_005190 [Penicillium hetheringtonii]